MKILFVATRYSYGRPALGPSFEHKAFFDSLHKAGQEIFYFDYVAVSNHVGTREMNRRLLNRVKDEEPDLVFVVPFVDRFIPETLERIREEPTRTVCWFPDDHWRFDVLTRRLAPCFDHVVTTSKNALDRYEEAGLDNVIKSQWACNHFLHHPTEVDQSRPVSFVGRKHGVRDTIISTLRSRGISVDVWGEGWSRGPIGYDEMKTIFNQTLVNLNFAYASRTNPDGGWWDTDRIRQELSRFANRWPSLDPIKRGAKALRDRLPTVRDSQGSRLAELPLQIKARTFEVPGSGCFLLTTDQDGVEAYYEPGEEIAVYNDLDDLVETIRYYLDDPEERRSIQKAGYQKTVDEHTYLHRFESILDEVGLSFDFPARAWGGEPVPGPVSRIPET